MLVWMMFLMVLWAGVGVPAHAQGDDKAAALKEADALVEKGEAYYAQGKYEEAVRVTERALALRERHLGSEHPDVAEALNNLGVMYNDQGEYERAESLHARALAIREKARGSAHPDVAESLNNLAALYQTRGEYEQAEPRYARALAIYESALGPAHLEVATCLNNLALLYDAQGEYERAESRSARALAIYEQALGPAHPQVALSLNNLALLYQARGEYERAEPLYVRALAIWAKALGPAHPHVAFSLHNLGGLYQARGEHERAEPLYARALDIWAKSLGPAHSNVAQSLNNLGALYVDRGEYEQAEPLYARALAIYEKTLGPAHPHVAFSLNNLGALYMDRGEYEQAAPLYMRALAIWEKALGPEHPHAAIALRSMALLHWASENRAQSLDFASRALALREKLLGILLSTGSEDQKRARLALIQQETEQSLAFHLQVAPDHPRAARLAMETLLRRKGRVLDATAGVFQALRQQLDDEARARLDELGRLRSTLATRLLRGPGREPEDAYKARNQALWKQIDALEDDLSKRSRAYREAIQPATIADVQARIPAQTALVELVLYRPFDPRFQGPKAGRWGTPRYAAYVLRNQGAPRAVDLGEAAPIDALVATWRDALQVRDIHVNDHARALDTRVMAPIRALLGEAQDIFLAPDGDLNLIPFAALVDEQGRFLVERYHITYLTSGRDLLRLDAPDAAREAPVIIADPLYGTFQLDAPPAEAGNLLDLVVEPLRGTAREARALAALLPNPRVWTGAQASEARVAQLHGPETLHIATHGIWLSDVQAVQQDPARLPDDTRGFAMRAPPPGLAKTFDPMLRSGLALAGFNTGGTGPDANDDGFLSALEMTSLDLHGTRLVALSACDTGVGEVKSGQGVYGLRRALVVAGAQTQVMSLWKVSDTATAHIMKVYYRKLRRVAGRSEAMRELQLELLQDPMRRHPFYWASFIVSGNPAHLYGEPLDTPVHPGRVPPTSGCACDSVSSTSQLPTAVLVFLVLFLALRSSSLSTQHRRCST